MLVSVVCAVGGCSQVGGGGVGSLAVWQKCQCANVPTCQCAKLPTGSQQCNLTKIHASISKENVTDNEDDSDDSNNNWNPDIENAHSYSYGDVMGVGVMMLWVWKQFQL